MIALITYQTRLEQRREEKAQQFKREMELFTIEQEKRYSEIRKYEYHRVKNEVKRGLRSSLDLLEFEIWKGF